MSSCPKHPGLRGKWFPGPQLAPRGQRVGTGPTSAGHCAAPRATPGRDTALPPTPRSGLTLSMTTGWLAMMS